MTLLFALIALWMSYLIILWIGILLGRIDDRPKSERGHNLPAALRPRHTTETDGWITLVDLPDTRNYADED